MRKRSLLFTGIILALIAVPSGPIFASNHPDSSASEWSAPENKQLTAHTFENAYLSTEATVQWTKEQLRQFQSKEAARQFYPKLEMASGLSDPLVPKLTITNLPGAKFAKIPADDRQGERIRTSVLDINAIQSGKPYFLSTVWFHASGEQDASVSLMSSAGYAQPNGTLNEVPDTERNLASIAFRQAVPIVRDAPSDPFYKFPYLNAPNVYPEGKPKNVKSYSAIDSKDALARYKAAAAEIGSSSGYVRFAVTFRSFYGQLDQLAKDYRLAVDQVYAVGKTESGEAYTVSWFDSNPRTLELLYDQRFVDFFVTELEGYASAKDLRKLLNHPDVDAVEIENQEGIPTGLYGLNQRFGQ